MKRDSSMRGLGRFAVYPLVIFFGVILNGCTHHLGNDREQVHAVIYRLIDADNRSDMETILSSYTDSIEFYPAGKDFIKGLSGVKSSYEKLLNEYKLNIQTQILETQLFSDHALVTGINKGQKTKLADSVLSRLEDKYIAFLVRNEKGDWKIDKLIWGLQH